MADVFDTGQIVAKPFSALSQKGVENRLERLNTEIITNPVDSTFTIENNGGLISFRSSQTATQEVEFQFKARLGDAKNGVEFMEISTAWLSKEANEVVTVPIFYLNRPFTLIVSTRIDGSNKPPFAQQAVIPAWPAEDETLTFNTCDNA